MKLSTLALTAALALSGAAAAHAQNFLNMDLNAMNNQFNARQNQQMGSMQNNMVAANMNNPQVVNAWRANSRGMSLQQYAYMWGATGGFTPGGMANYNNTSRQIAARDAASVASYRQGQANYAAAIAERNGHASANIQEAGRGLQGQATYYNPMTGGYVPLSYMNNAPTMQGGGYTYTPMGNGQYRVVGPNGQAFISQAPRSPW